MSLVKPRLGFLCLLILVLAAITLWRISRKERSTFPVEIRLSRFITQPQVVCGSAVLILAADGTVWAWGENKIGATEYGGLLSPSNVRGNWRVPRRLEVGSNWITLAAGYTDAIGIEADGSLWGWSYAAAGNLWSLGVCRNPPALVAPGTNWLAVAAGSGHALALRCDGTLWVCGMNEHGQLGDGKPINRRPSRRQPASPAQFIQAGTNTNWIAISANGASSLGLQSDGSLWQWGAMQVALAAGTPEINLSLPTRVDAATNWADIATGEFCFLGRKRDGSLWAWGVNARPLGCTNQTIPSLVNTITNWSAAAIGLGHTVALQPNGTLWESGTTYSEAGGPNRLKDSAISAIVGQRMDWENVWAAAWVSFGLTTDGTLWTWGYRPDNPREGSEAMESVSTWLRRHHLPSPMYVRRPVGSATPWPLVRFTTNSSPITQ